MGPKVFGDQGSGDGPGRLSRSRVRKKPRNVDGKGIEWNFNIWTSLFKSSGTTLPFGDVLVS